jgi:DNA-binding transcriptional MocR family regulator
LWARVRTSLKVAAWHEQAAQRGVLFQPGRLFAFDGRAVQYVRLGYGKLTEREMTTAVTRLREAAIAASAAPRVALRGAS